MRGLNFDEDKIQVIRLDYVTLGFVEAPLRRRWSRLFRCQPHAPDIAGDNVELIDYIMAWYLVNGHKLKQSLHAIGLGPLPDGEEDIEDASQYPGGHYGRAGIAYRLLPPVFARQVDHWLAIRPGRRLWLQVGNITAMPGSVAELEDLLESASIHYEDTNIRLR